MTSPTILYVAETADSVRAKIVGYAQTANLLITNWIAGAVGQQVLETVAQTLAGELAIVAQAIRGAASLDTSTDPGDVDPYDPANASLAPSPGFLSNKGRADYGTERIGETYATGTINFANGLVPNSGAVNQTIAPGALTFQSTVPNDAGVYPTYRNSNTAPISVGVGVTVSVPVEAEQPGIAYNAASANIVTILVNTLPGVTVTNPSPILGTDRQPADAYREACREAASLTSPNGPSDSYRYLATTGRDDGTFGNSLTGNSLGITKIYVSQDNSSGIVSVYYAGPSGASGLNGAIPNPSGPFTPGTTFVQAANYLISNTPGVIAVPDAITFSGQAATEVTIAVTFLIKFKAKDVGYAPGTYAYTSPTSLPVGLRPLGDAILAAYDAYFAAEPIGGDDQDANGNGFVWTEDFKGVLYGVSLYPGTVLRGYDAVVTAPSGSSTALATGHVAVLGALTGGIILV